MPEIGPDNPPIEARPEVDESQDVEPVRSQLPPGLDHWPSASERVHTELAEADVVFVLEEPAVLVVEPEPTSETMWQSARITAVASRDATLGEHLVEFRPNSEYSTLAPRVGGKLILGCKADASGGSLRVSLVMHWDGAGVDIGAPSERVLLTLDEVLEENDD